MTVPFGMYLRYYFRCSLPKTAVLSLGLYLFIRGAMHRPLFYERLSRTELVSTVGE